ncbi:TPA: hypothetical protein RI297_004901, partial [Escherichia coli]|nr:hypothetical protein [Escherichia coli]
MTIYAEELRIMMDAIMDIIFDHGTHRQARTFMAVLALLQIVGGDKLI